MCKTNSTGTTTDWTMDRCTQCHSIWSKMLANDIQFFGILGRRGLFIPECVHPEWVKADWKFCEAQNDISIKYEISLYRFRSSWENVRDILCSWWWIHERWQQLAWTRNIIGWRCYFGHNQLSFGSIRIFIPGYCWIFRQYGPKRSTARSEMG